MFFSAAVSFLRSHSSHHQSEHVPYEDKVEGSRIRSTVDLEVVSRREGLEIDIKIALMLVDVVVEAL